MICQQCATILVHINGETFAVHAKISLLDFLNQRAVDINKPFACAHNGKKITKEKLTQTHLTDGDRIDWIQAPT